MTSLYRVSRVAVAALLGIVACTAPPAAVDATKRGPVPWVDSSVTELCVPVEPPQTARGYVPGPAGCGQDLVWPCERGAVCLGGNPAACVCECDVGRDDDCAGVWFAHWYPGAVTSARCDAGVCVLRRAQ